MHNVNRFNRREFLIAGTAAALLPGFGSMPLAAQTEARSVSFLAFGDWGRDGSESQMKVAAKLAQTARESRSRFIVTTGDNFYPSGVASTKDAHWQKSFEDVYAAPPLQVPWYPALGNHDHRGNVAAQIAYSGSSRRWKMPASYYAVSAPFPGGEAHLFFLDTTELIGDGRWFGWTYGDRRGQEQLAWFEDVLAASKARWKVVIGHHPVHSGGHHGGSEVLVRKVRPLLERYGVAMYINGHDHCLQHVIVDGISYLTTGAGAKPNAVQSIEGTQFASEELGFLEIELGQTARLRFISQARGIVHAHTISHMRA
jgi:acid phosphatase